MNLPRVKINFANGAIGAVTPMEDGTAALLANLGAAGTMVNCPALGTPSLVTKLADLDNLGLTAAEAATNPALKNLRDTVADFYAEAGSGAKLWLLAVESDDSTPLDDNACIIDPDDQDAGTAADLLLQAAAGTVRILAFLPYATPGIAQLRTLVQKLHTLALRWTEHHYAPILTLLQARTSQISVADLNNPANALSNLQRNRVAVVAGGHAAATDTEVCLGLVLGRIAAIPVQRSIARVKDGPIASDPLLVGGYDPATATENGTVQRLYDAGFIVPRTFVGKNGTYWSDDTLCTEASDDYALIPRRRVIDKAYRIAYQTLVDELHDEIPVTAEGKIPASVVQAIETAVESAVINQMTNFGNLATDPADDSDNGVQCSIDPDQNIVATSRLDVSLRVRPYGYAKYIDVDLGFQTLAQ